MHAICVRFMKGEIQRNWKWVQKEKLRCFVKNLDMNFPSIKKDVSTYTVGSRLPI